MSGAPAGPEPVVTKRGDCERIVCFGAKEHLVKHRWKQNKATIGIELATAHDGRGRVKHKKAVYKGRGLFCRSSEPETN